MKSKSKIHQFNFCSAQCKNEFNSKMFSAYNQTSNPMNMPGRTLDERVQMRNRMLTFNKQQGKETKTYEKFLGEPEHRRIARLKIGRDLLPNEVVHHIDGDKHNNKPSNLLVMTKAEHTRLHVTNYWRNKNGKK